MAFLACGPILSLAPTGAAASEVLPVPALIGPVIDQTGTLDTAQREALAQSLAEMQRRTGSQVVVLMVATTQPEDIAAYSLRVANQYGLGRRDAGGGLLLVVAKDDRRVRIEVSRALEGSISNLRAQRIIDEEMVPAFRAGDFAGGLKRAVVAIDAAIAAIPPRSAGAASSPSDAAGGRSANPPAARVDAASAAVSARPGPVSSAAPAASDVARPARSLFPIMESIVALTIAAALLGLIGFAIQSRRCPRCKSVFSARETLKLLVDERSRLKTTQRTDKHPDKSGRSPSTAEQQERVTVIDSEWMHEYRCSRCGHVWRRTSRSTRIA